MQIHLLKHHMASLARMVYLGLPVSLHNSRASNIGINLELARNAELYI